MNGVFVSAATVRAFSARATQTEVSQPELELLNVYVSCHIWPHITNVAVPLFIIDCPCSPSCVLCVQLVLVNKKFLMATLFPFDRRMLRFIMPPRFIGSIPHFFFFSNTSTFQLLNKPWSRVSSLLPPGSCLQFLSRIGFSNPTARRFFIRCWKLTLSRFPQVNLHMKKSQRIYTSMHPAGLEIESDLSQARG